MDWVVKIYRLSQTFPATEKFGLASQIQRATVSIASSIAEGHARKTSGVFMNYLSIAAGSLAELETRGMLAERLDFCPKEISRSCLHAPMKSVVC